MEQVDSLENRLRWMIKKGYLRKENTKYLRKDGIKYVPTSEGLEAIIKVGGKTKHSYYESTANWEKTLRPNAVSKSSEVRG